MATDDDENQTLQKAIQESLAGSASATAKQFGDLSSNKTSQGPPRRANIEDRIKEITQQPAFQLPQINDPFGDTWVFIDPPSKQPEQDDFDYARYSKHYETPILVKKETLLKHHFPDPEGFSLEALFGATAQFRTIRRRKLTAKLREQPNVKFVIDLTPPIEGDEAVYLTTELSCSQGVRLWYQAGDIWSISKMLVGGQEEYTSVARQKVVNTSKAQTLDLSANSSSKTPNVGIPAVKEDGTKSSTTLAGNDPKLRPTSPNILLPLEYTPLRHRSAIQRVIAALMGLDPKIDSAPKWWSTFAVANYFGLKESPVTDYIIRWLRAYPNSFFLEVCPEISIRVAQGLQNNDLCRDCFAVLVGEEALDSLVCARKYNSNNQFSVYGRRKEDLPEKIFTSIQYASKRFQERIRTKFEEFAGEEMKWVESLPEARKLLSYQKPELQVTVNSLLRLLKDYVRGTIHRVLRANYDYVLPSAEFHHPGGEDLLQRLNRSEIWTGLSLKERILTRTFWSALLSFTFFDGYSNLNILNDWGMDWNDPKPGDKPNDSLFIGEVLNQDLNQLIYEGRNRSLDLLNLPIFTLPDRTRSQIAVDPPLHYEPVIDLSERNQQTGNGLFRAQSTSNHQSVQHPLPTRPIDVPQPTFRPDAKVFQPQVKYNPGNLLVPQDATPNWPLGAPRHQDWWTYEPSNDKLAMRNSGLPLNYFPPPASSGFPILPSQDKVVASNTDESRPYIQEGQGGRSTPPFFREPQECPETKNSETRTLPKMETPVQRESFWAPARTAFFDLQEFFLQARAHIETEAKQKLKLADCGVRDEPHEIGITNTLVCLENSEWKYLPLWAGGNDDDTGGVFNDQLPSDDLGFSTSGPGIHTGFTPANSVGASSEFEMVDSDYAADTANTSMVNNRSFAGVLNRKNVYAVDSIESSSSDDFDMVTPDGSSVVEEALQQTETQEQHEAANPEFRGDMPEDFADLFDSYEDDEDTDRADDTDSLMNDESDEEDMIMV